jgi:hypothetical protein
MGNTPTPVTNNPADKSRQVNKRPRNTGEEIDSIFVGNLAREVGQELLQVTIYCLIYMLLHALTFVDQIIGNYK